MVDLATRNDRSTIAVPVDFDSPRQVGISFQITQALQGAEVVMNCRRGVETDCFANFSDGGGKATLLHAGLNAFKDAALTEGEGEFAHACIVRVFAPRVKHLFVFSTKSLVRDESLNEG